MILAILAIGVCLGAGACAVFNQAKFGKPPEGERLARVSASPHYRDGEFHNTVATPTLVEGQSTFTILVNDLFTGKVRPRPAQPLPTERPDLASLALDNDLVIWLGHSGYYMQLAGNRILVDPVFSDHGAPFSFLNKTFSGTDLYSAADMPEIDYLIISHDHWDHLDHATVADLLPKVKVAVMPLGVGAHFAHWGYPAEKLVEADWNTALRFENDLTVHVTPARHYSGRLFAKNKTLWAGFVLETPERRIFFSGDSGYGPHFADIAGRFDGFDLAALDGGQYDPRWPLDRKSVV